MTDWQAPAKLNLDLRLASPDSAGMHPLRSLVQSIEWCDRLTLEEGDEDVLEIDGDADGVDGEGSNLVWKAVGALEMPSRPPLYWHLTKKIPVGAGLGGGSSDAAAALRAVRDLLGAGVPNLDEVAARVGADVTYFLTGGTAWMEGFGEQVTPAPPLESFAVAVAVPPFELATPQVYGRWDELGEPLGVSLSGRRLPPPLRTLGELRNDLTPAAVSLRPDLGEWMADLTRRWSTPVLMTGSGPACFGIFTDVDEAQGAVGVVEDVRAAFAAALRPIGVSRRGD